MAVFGFAASVVAARRRRAAPGPDAPRPDDEAGFTLIELLIAIIIMALAFTAVLAGIFTAITVTYDNRQQADADKFGRLLAEKLKQTDPPYAYKPCAVASDYQPVGAALTQLDLDGWRVEVEDVDYWNGGGATSTNTYVEDVSGCTVTAGRDSGLQRITVVARPPAGRFRADKVTQRVVVYKRDTRTDCYLAVEPRGGTCE